MDYEQIKDIVNQYHFNESHQEIEQYIRIGEELSNMGYIDFWKEISRFSLKKQIYLLNLDYSYYMYENYKKIFKYNKIPFEYFNKDLFITVFVGLKMHEDITGESPRMFTKILNGSVIKLIYQLFSLYGKQGVINMFTNFSYMCLNSYQQFLYEEKNKINKCNINIEPYIIESSSPYSPTNLIDEKYRMEYLYQCNILLKKDENGNIRFKDATEILEIDQKIDELLHMQNVDELLFEYEKIIFLINMKHTVVSLNKDKQLTFKYII